MFQRKLSVTRLTWMMAHASHMNYLTYGSPGEGREPGGGTGAWGRDGAPGSTSDKKRRN